MLKVLLIMMLFIALPVQAASLQATIDRNPIGEHETVQLTLTLRDFDGNINPDLSALEGLFDVLGRSQSSQIRYINGSMDSSKTINITLAPKQAGTLVIPSIDVGNLSSQPIALHVRKAGSQAAGQVNELALLVEVDNSSPYLQQQVILTVRLIHSINLAEGILPDPEVIGVEVYKLGDDKSYQSLQNGQQVGIIERRYALLPQQSGEFTIPSIQFRGRLQGRSAGRFGGLFNNQGRQVQTRSTPIRINVKKQPQGDSGIPWLPAQSLVLQEQWSMQPPQFRVGEPITRTLILQAQGLSATQLPELILSSQPSFKVYPDQAQLESQATEQGITGTRIEKYAIMPTQVGQLTLPAITLPWWNSQSKTMEVVKLPKRIIDVLPAIVDNDQQQSPINIAPVVTNTTTAIAETSNLWPWQLATLLFALAWLSTLVMWWKKAPGTKYQEKTPTQNRPRPTLKEISKACHNNQATQARNALLAWGKASQPQHAPRNLIELAQWFEEEAVQQALKHLDASLYTNQNNWDGRACWGVIESALMKNKVVRDQAGINILPSLYG